MKTTIELPDGLYAEAKAVALRRRTTLKAMIEHALRREVGFGEALLADEPFVLNEFGFPVLKARGITKVTSREIYELLDNEDN